MRSANSTGANAATAPPVLKAKRTEIALRLLSAAVLAPLAFAAAFQGGYIFTTLVAVFALVMAWEWAKLCAAHHFGRAGAVLIAAVAAILYADVFYGTEDALIVMAGGALFVFFIARAMGAAHPPWLAAGVVYIGIPVASLLWLRDASSGRAIVLWLLALVWATDIGAYLAGKAIGGARLAPAISPQKTWAGGVGGLAAAGLVSLAAVRLSHPSHPGLLIALGIALGIAAELGDLLESACKRRFGVKDMSRVIPGHGGVFDRVDGLLVAAPVAGLLIWGGLSPWP